MSKKHHRRLVALLGHPVSHSHSPHIQNAAFVASEIDLRYVALDVRPEYLAEAVTAMRTLNFAGANVTIPHKQAIVSLVDELAPTALAVGAVNTLVFSGPPDSVSILGDNTDVAGFLSPLEPYREALAGARAVVWGGGGASRAVVYALTHEVGVSSIAVVVRNPEAFIDYDSISAGTGLTIIPWSKQGDIAAEADLLVNTTPLGMWPHVDDSPCASPTCFHSEQVVYDLVYNPRQTRLLREAEKRGASVISGLDMFLGQAGASFRLWTGTDMPMDTARTALSAVSGPIV